MIKRKRRRGVIRSIALIITGGNGKFTSFSVPRQCLLVCSVKLGWSLPLPDRKTGTA
jgi:hypothetical protein